MLHAMPVELCTDERWKNVGKYDDIFRMRRGMSVYPRSKSARTPLSTRTSRPLLPEYDAEYERVRDQLVLNQVLSDLVRTRSSLNVSPRSSVSFSSYL